MTHRSALTAIGIALAITLAASTDSHAICDVIPQSKIAFQGATGSVDRPFASPGDVVAVSLDAAAGGCEEGASFDSDGPPLMFPHPLNNAVTWVYTPDGGTPAAIVIAPLGGVCASLDLVSCQAQLAGGSVTCVETAPVVALSQRFAFEVPSGMTGPSRVAISPTDEPLPCQIATTRCADLAPGVATACIDELYESDDTCPTALSPVGRLFSHFTGLPSPNPFHEMCTSSDPDSPCVGGAPPDAKATIDASGNLLIPFDWSVALLPGSFPTPRLVRFTSDFEAFQGGGNPIDPPGQGFHDSFSVGGRLVPPFFEEVEDGATGDPAFLGSIDAPRGIVRLLRRSPSFRECRDDGTNSPLVPGVPCTQDSDCSTGSSCGSSVCYSGGLANGSPCAGDQHCGGGAECGPSVFDFASRLVAGGGELTIAAGSYQAESLNPVPFDGLARSAEAILSVRSEPLENDSMGIDLNGDGDSDDIAVLSLRRPDTGETIELGGAGSGVVGPATTRVELLPLELPAFSLEADRAAFLLKVAGEVSSPGIDAFDTTLAVKRVDVNLIPDGFADETPAGFCQAVPSTSCSTDSQCGVNDVCQLIAADGAPFINNQPLVLSNGRVFFRESEARSAERGTSRMDQTASGAWPNAEVHSHLGGAAVVGDIDISDDGRFVAFASAASDIGGLANTTGLPRVYVLDRDSDENGIYDESGGIAYHADPDGAICDLFQVLWDEQTSNPAISGDGRFLVYERKCSSSNPSFNLPHIVLWDRDDNENGIFDDTVPTTNFITGVVEGTVTNPTIDDDGTKVAFQTATAVSGLDTNSVSDIYIFHRAAGTFQLVMNNLLGVIGNGPSVTPEFSGDGAHLAFASKATNLESGGGNDANGTWDVFARGPNSFSIKQISLIRDADGNRVAPNGPSQFPSISRNGRIVSFSSSASDLPGGDQLGQLAYVVDRDVDADGVYDELARNQVVPLPMSLGGIANFDARSKVSPDGRWVSISGLAPVAPGFPGYGLFDRLTRTQSFVSFANGPIALSVSLPTAISEHGHDVVQLTFDCNFPPPLFICDGLRLHGNIGGIDRSDANADISGDGDPLDTLLSVYDADANGGAGLITRVAAADRVAVSGDRAAFLLPENAVNGAPRCAALGGLAVAGGCDLSNDGDADDRVVHLYDAATDTLQNLGLAARDVLLNDGWVVALSETGGASQAQVYSTGAGASWVTLGDALDAQLRGSRVAIIAPKVPSVTPQIVRLFELTAPATATPVGFVDEFQLALGDPPANELVLGDQILAFRSWEGDAGELNDDGDSSDSVMRVVVLATGRLFETQQAAIPCPIEACDPNEPYRVDGQHVVFITMEVDQTGPNLAPGCRDVGGECDLDGDGRTDGFIVQFYNAAAAIAANDAASGRSVLAAVTTGVCTDTGEACFDQTNCAAGLCLVPPGVCATSTETGCDPEMTGNGACAADQFCDPPSGKCFQYGGVCEVDGVCGGGICLPADRGFHTQDNPLAAEPEGGQRQLSRGVCSGPMPDTCLDDIDCVGSETCDAVLVYATSADEDGDTLCDAVDNCPGIPNGDQLDVDQDGIGDACDRESCGNGIQEYTETCDHGVDNGSDGLCDASCAYIGAGAACSDGVDNDGDGKVDTGDAGCASGADTSERDAAKACDDGVDNDGDYGSDANGDPGCGTNPNNFREDPACSDGIDNDGDGKVDYDGYGGLYEPDPNCSTASAIKETPVASRCGLGFELVLLLPLLARLGALRRRRSA